MIGLHKLLYFMYDWITQIIVLHVSAIRLRGTNFNVINYLL
jgi:hypothetical protein